MEQLYQSHLDRLEKFTGEVNLSDTKKIELYQIVRSLLEDGGIIYTYAFVEAELSEGYKPSQSTREVLRKASGLVQKITQEMMKTEDKTGM